jgi:hypothetical protein
MDNQINQSGFFRSPDNGLWLPVSMLPKIHDIERKSIFLYSDVFQQSTLLSKLFNKYEVAIKKSPDLDEMMGSAKTLHEEWQKNRCKDLTDRNILWDALTMKRICEAILPLDGNVRAKEILQRLTDGHLRMMKHGYSLAKNTLWELEIWSRAKRAGLEVELQEPDVVWTDKGEKTGVACKKIYSDNNADKSLQDAVRQINDSTTYGFAALDLDEFSPEAKQFVTNDIRVAGKQLQELNGKFLREHKERFRRYFKSDRLTGAIVSTSCITIIKKDGGDMPFFNAQWHVWTHPNLSIEHKRRIESFKQALNRTND